MPVSKPKNPDPSKRFGGHVKRNLSAMRDLKRHGKFTNHKKS